MLEYAQTGLDDTPGPYLPLEATLGDLHYQQFTADEPCAASYLSDETDGQYSLPELAAMLPTFRTMIPGGSAETINGVIALPFTPTGGGLKLPGEASIDGEVWLAEDGGYLVRYRLNLTGGPDTFDPDTEGVYTWEYNLEALDPSLSLRPADCPLAPPDLPLLPDAAETLRQPTYLSYTTASSPADVLAFYNEALDSAGFSPLAEGYNLNERAAGRFERDNLWVDVYAEAGPATQVIVRPLDPLAFSAAPEQAETPEATRVDWEETPAYRASNSLNLLLGSKDAPAFDSYHIEINQQKPVWKDGQAAVKESTLVADDPTGMFASLGQGITGVNGMVWVDNQTGALLKLAADYEADLQQDGAVVGSGSGLIEIEVSQVGAVSVKLPGQ